MEKTEQELIDIADRMLANLEKQYWQTQQQNINFDKECPENNQELHGDYQLLDGEDQNNELNDSESDQEENNQNNEQDNQKNEEQNNINVEEVKQNPRQQAKAVCKQVEQNVEELMEVFPTEQWVPEQKEVNINSEKIKQFTLKMNLPVPDWVNNQDMLKNRIMELFGKKK